MPRLSDLRKITKKAIQAGKKKAEGKKKAKDDSRFKDVLKGIDKSMTDEAREGFSFLMIMPIEDSDYVVPKDAAEDEFDLVGAALRVYNKLKEDYPDFKVCSHGSARDGSANLYISWGVKNEMSKM